MSRTRKCWRCGQTHECVNRPRKSEQRKKSRTWRREKNGHVYEYLVGGLDIVKRRMEIYIRAGGDVVMFDEDQPELIEDLKSAMCQGCAETHPVGWFEGEWFHNSRTKGGRRCDCAECALWTCKPYHAAYHNRVISGRAVTGAVAGREPTDE